MDQWSDYSRADENRADLWTQTSREAEEARGRDAFRPNRDRYVSTALQAYALMTTSAARGAVRDLSQLTAGSHKR